MERPRQLHVIFGAGQIGTPLAEQLARHGAFDRVADDATPAADEERPGNALDAVRVPDLPRPVVDERVGEHFTAPAGPIERFLYAASVLHCLPVGMSEQPSAATGTAMRPDALCGYAAEAGFTVVEELSIEHPLFRFYRLDGRA